MIYLRFDNDGIVQVFSKTEVPHDITINDIDINTNNIMHYQIKKVGGNIVGIELRSDLNEYLANQELIKQQLEELPYDF